MTLWAISDLHLGHPRNRDALDVFVDQADGRFVDDGLILAGDIAESPGRLGDALDRLGACFRTLLWTPGNHDLWIQAGQPDAPRGVAKYQQMVEVCRARGVRTPEDPWLRWPRSGRADDPVGDDDPVIALLFLLYDYSFRPAHVTRDGVVAWSLEEGILCTDEHLLKPDPYPTRDAWCHARCDDAERRLAALDGAPTVLVNHWPLREDVLKLRRVPRFSPWCGTVRTIDWHRRFRAEVAVYGHQHVRGVDRRDTTRFEEVSFGYPRDWDPARGLIGYLRPILPSPRR
ncbi:MAG: metallophosphoesterase [Acidobacteriota bacterium]